MIRQLAHLCLKTSQLPRMTEFYRDALGATVKFRYLNRAGEPVGCYFAFGENTFVEIFDHADAHRRSNSAKPFEPLEEPRDAWIKDPDGNLIELQEYTPQSRQFTGEDFREI